MLDAKHTSLYYYYKTQVNFAKYSKTQQRAWNGVSK